MTEPSSSDRVRLGAAFPSTLSEDVAAVERTIPATSYVHALGFDVRLGGERLVIPYRIYNPEPDTHVVAALSAIQQVVVHCFYTRQHDGHVRARVGPTVVSSPRTRPFSPSRVQESRAIGTATTEISSHGRRIPGSR